MIYFLISILAMVLFTHFPRRPVNAYPDWGTVVEERIPTVNGKFLECWVIYPDSMKEIYEKDPNNSVLTKNTIIFAHGNTRNRGRMVERAKHWNTIDFTVILFSFRDHGGSDKERFGVSIVQFTQDMNSVVKWWNKPVIICGHSMGAAVAIITAKRNELVKALITDASPSSYPHNIRYAIRPFFGKLSYLFFPGAVVGLKLINIKHSVEDYDPLISAKQISIPVLILHGKKDPQYPYSVALTLDKHITNSEVHLIENANHSTVHQDPSYFPIIHEFLKKNQLVDPNQQS